MSQNLSNTVLRKKMKDQRDRCFYCGEYLRDKIIEIDHILPFSKYKNGTVENKCLACRECNRLKSDLSLVQFKEKLKDKFPEKIFGDDFYFEIINILPKWEKDSLTQN